MSAVTTILQGVGVALNFAGCMAFLGRMIPAIRKAWPLRSEHPWFAIGFTLWAVAYLMDGAWWLTAIDGVIAAGNAVSWWLDRRNRKRKRAAKALGAKSAALIAALVQRARESAQPRPVLRPQRQGA